MSSSQHFTIIFPTRKPTLLLADINNANAAGFILWGWWLAHATGKRPGHQELQTGAEALHCQGWLVRRGEARLAGKPHCWIYLASLPKRLASKVRSQDKFAATFCFPTRSRENAHKVWGLRKSCNKFISCRNKEKDSGPVLAPCTGSASQRASLYPHLCQPLEPDPGTPRMRVGPPNIR